MEKSGSTIMHNVQQSLFHKHAERFVLYSTRHSSYFLTLAGIAYIKRKNINVNIKIVMVNTYKFKSGYTWQCASFYQDQHQIPIKAIFCIVVCLFVLNSYHHVSAPLTLKIRDFVENSCGSDYWNFQK